MFRTVAAWNFWILFGTTSLLGRWGQLELSERPGFGMELDEAKIEKKTRMSWE